MNKDRLEAAYEAYRNTPLDIACCEIDENEEICIRAAISAYLQPGDNSELVAGLREIAEFLAANGGDGKTIYETGDVQAKAAAAIEHLEAKSEIHRLGMEANRQQAEAAEQRCAELEGALTKLVERCTTGNRHRVSGNHLGVRMPDFWVVEEARTALNNTEKDDEGS